jgi:hypothetical protein
MQPCYVNLRQWLDQKSFQMHHVPQSQLFQDNVLIFLNIGQLCKMENTQKKLFGGRLARLKMGDKIIVLSERS